MLELEFITQISQDSAVEFTKSAHFNQALDILSQLLDSPYLSLSHIYNDKDNHELQLSSCRYHQPTARLSQAKSTSAETQLPNYLRELSQSKQECAVSCNELDQQLGFSSSTQQDCSIQLVPFFEAETLIGVLGVQAETSPNLLSTFPASYWVLNNLLLSHHRHKVASVKLDTYQIVLDLMPQRVFWKNRSSRYLGCNQAFATDASIDKPENIIGLNDFDTFPEQAELYRSDDAHTMETRKHMISSEEPQTHQDGTQIWLRTSKRPIITKNDVVVGLVGTYDDITLLKQTQQQLHSAKTELEERVTKRTEQLSESNSKLEKVIEELKTTQSQLVETEKMSALGRLVAGVAHEINTPLGIAVTSSSHLTELSNDLDQAVLSGNISKSKFHNICENINVSSELILRNLQRASDLVSNFKMVAVDQSHDEKRQIVLMQYLHDVVNAMTPKTNKKNIKVFLSGDETLSLLTYPGSIAQIITNLIDNAMIHAFANSDSGEIKIHFMVKNQYLELYFEDSGEGIEPEQVNKIFEPFFTSKRGHGGSGLGLSIIYNIITQRFNGNIHCESVKGKGARFVVSLPLD
ncbi:PAS domain-containing sensor histidine kinase [Agarivorans sp. 1_MG-2023]|uniref:PAS domain-containing sensor histidine kinase n=1 Tax=Agarivorans sp. 1_MG-2023 TaxID=3062634 RepID=UPI0026E18713|nr:PAS domain-containing sensor histidine kinase [Agarivorans sp. 1_MG-2023]MDO6764850.1 PAS domain-containing sensor histidine kinase [Agarivorans sp. 1_MG-2023]